MSEKIQRVSSIIQIVVLVAVLASLVNLSVELRHIRQAIKAQTALEIRASYSQHFAHVTQSPDLADILMRLAKDTEGEEVGVKMRFFATLFYVFTSHENAFNQKANGTLELRDWHLFNAGMMDLINLPGVREFWEKRNHWYSEEFRDYINNEVIPAAASIKYEPIG
jgi:hypothetical protein